MKQSIFILLLIALLTGCNAYEKVAYLQQAGTQAAFSATEQSAVPDPIIKVGDVLMITVNTNTPEAAIPFNLPLVPAGESSKTYSGGSGYLSYGLSMQNYLVDMEGNLVYPVIGKIKVAGLRKAELAEQIKQTIYPRYITEEPIVLIRFVNYDNEKVSILEALALAGDMTIYGRRESVLLVREQNGNRETVRIDIRDKNLVNSPYFYLQQNDVLYVEPNDSRSRASAISAAESLSISIVGTLISLTTLLINILR